MRTLLISAILMFVATTTFANEKMYNKLNKLYQVDRNKCMEKTKQILAKNNKEAVAYYFRSIIYYDKSKESPTLKGIYLQVNRSVTSAIKFEENSSDNQRTLVHWDEHIASLKNRSEKLITSLNRNGYEDLTATLLKNLSKVNSLAPYFNTNEKTDLLANVESDITILDEAHSATKNTGELIPEGHFFGLPKGNERILSSSIDYEIELLRLINLERKKNQLAELKWEANLAYASRYHAYDQSTQGYFNHDTYDVKNGGLVWVTDFTKRIKQFYTEDRTLSECIAAGGLTPQETLNQWLNSPSHKAIIIDKKAKMAGIGFIANEESALKTYWVIGLSE